MKASMKFIMLFLAIILLMVNFDLSAKSNGEKFIKPIKIGYVSSRYGNRKHPFTGKIQHHNGIDIAAPNGTSLYAAKSGKVIFADFKKNYGNTIIIDHVNQKTVYTQMSKILVSNGDMVNQGQTIGKVGSSGISTGPHLHFEIRENDKSVNPENFIDFSAK